MFGDKPAHNVFLSSDFNQLDGKRIILEILPKVVDEQEKVSVSFWYS